MVPHGLPVRRQQRGVRSGPERGHRGGNHGGSRGGAPRKNSTTEESEPVGLAEAEKPPAAGLPPPRGNSAVLAQSTVGLNQSLLVTVVRATLKSGLAGW